MSSVLLVATGQVDPNGSNPIIVHSLFMKCKMKKENGIRIENVEMTMLRNTRVICFMIHKVNLSLVPSHSNG